MKINIYYGGRGLVDDPSLFVLEKMQAVFTELNIKYERFNLFEDKNKITTLSQTITDADAVIMATTVEWLGMGGYLQLLLDSCWLYADKSKISNVYMFPVVMSKTYGEKDVELAIIKSWEMIGGIAHRGVCAYVENTTDFEFNQKYNHMIEKAAEDIYRTVQKKRVPFPSSSLTIKNKVMKDFVEFTPQESKQLSKYAADDTFVKTQKKDIESLASIYKEMMTDEEQGGDDYYIDVLKKHFAGKSGYSGSYQISIIDKNKDISLDIDAQKLDIKYDKNPDADVNMRLKKEVFDKIVAGKITFHGAFMTGDMITKGDFRSLRMLDDLFTFNK